MQIGKSGLQKYANEFSDHYFSKTATYQTYLLTKHQFFLFKIYCNSVITMSVWKWTFRDFDSFSFNTHVNIEQVKKIMCRSSASTCLLKTLLIYVVKPWTTLFYELCTSSFFQQIHINVFFFPLYSQICTLNSPFPHYPTLTENHSCLWINSLLLPSCYTQPVCSLGWSRLGSPQFVT